jgi:hypothetical protein
MLRIIYDVLYDALAIVDVVGGVLLAAIWVQSGYVALFRVMHGGDAGRATAPAKTPAQPANPALPRSPWGAG